MSKKKKKEKVIYYDDGSTISDMSRVNRKSEPRPQNQQNNRADGMRTVRATSKWKTYWQTVRMMIVPMLIVLGVLCVVFLGLLGIGHCAA